VNREYYDTINGVEDAGQEVDYREVKVTCSHCQQESRITALKDKVGVFCAREYLYFSDVQVDDLQAFETQLRTILPDAEVKSYWYT
jgi:hypothetical protein